MTSRVNLLPVAYQQRTRRARQFKMWVAMSVALGVGQVMSAMFLRLQASETRNIHRKMADMRDDQRTAIKTLAALTAQKRALARQRALAAQLRRKHRWSQTFAVLTGHLPPTVLLTRLASDPPRDQSARARTAAPWPRARQPRQQTDPDAREGLAKGFLIEGIAIDHDSVAAFLGALDERSGLGTCELKSTSLQPFMNGHAVAFEIHTRW